jgi:hypothetical protein
LDFFNRLDTLFRGEENKMPTIQFEKKHRANGLYTLIRHGDVYCLPDSVFIAPQSSLDCLDKAKIPYTVLQMRFPNAKVTVGQAVPGTRLSGTA